MRYEILTIQNLLAEMCHFTKWQLVELMEVEQREVNLHILRL